MHNPSQITSSQELNDPDKTDNCLPGFSLPAPRECRICLSGFENSGNRLVSPCECQGSVRFVHEGCLMQWL